MTEEILDQFEPGGDADGVAPEAVPIETADVADAASEPRKRRSLVNLVLWLVVVALLVGIGTVGYYAYRELQLRKVPRTLVDVRIEALKGEMARNPNAIELNLQLAALYYDQQRYDEALETLKKVETAKPRPEPAWIALAVAGEGKIAEKRGDIKGALSLYQKSMQITETPDAQFALGVLYLQEKQYDKAIPNLVTFVEAFPSDGVALLKLGNAYEGAGKMDLALRAYKDAAVYLGQDDAQVQEAIKRVKGQQ